MDQLSDDGQRIVADVAQRHGFSQEAVINMLMAVNAGYGTQAQFSHPEFGGMGQWSSGGMVMIGDMFNNQLKGRVSALADELSQLVQSQPMFYRPAQSQSQSGGGGQQQMQGGGSFQSQGGGQMPGGQQQMQGGQMQGGGTSLFVPGPGSGGGDWWPADLGAAGSLGSQNNLRYAYFPAARRLAIDVGGDVSVYDTGDHQISGFGQQQSGDQSITFTSQYGTVRVADLPMVSGPGAPQTGGPSFEVPAEQGPAQQPVIEDAGSQPGQGGSPPSSSDEIFALIEKLSDLHQKGILNDQEFETKKSELLSRL